MVSMYGDSVTPIVDPETKFVAVRLYTAGDRTDDSYQENMSAEIGGVHTPSGTRALY